MFPVRMQKIFKTVVSRQRWRVVGSHPANRFVSQYSCSQAVRQYSSDDKEPFHLDKTPITIQLWGKRLVDNVDSKSKDCEDKPKRVIVEKTPKDSRLAIRYNFSQDKLLKHNYLDSSGGIMKGKLFEDLDALAGTIASKHCCTDSFDESINLVTASVDKITQQSSICINSNDYILCGQIAYVGRSSMDILIQMYVDNGIDISKAGINEFSESGITPVLSSYFTFAARDPKTSKAVQINQLQPETTLEKNLFSSREQSAHMRKKSNDDSYMPDRALLTSLVERGIAMEDMPALSHPNAVLMPQTTLENCFICQPQNVNTNGTVFGGFLMHRAFDLAVATGYTFAGVKPRMVEVDKIEFRKPVDIGDLVRLKSRVVFSSDDPVCPTAHVEVICQIVRPERASSFVSNKFTFIFAFRESVTLKRVLPVTYEQAARLLLASKWQPTNKY